MEMITVSITQDGNMFVSHCLDYDIASQGHTSNEAVENIKEAVSLFLEAHQSKFAVSIGRIEQIVDRA